MSAGLAFARRARREAAEAVNRTATRPPRVVSIVAGQDDESPSAANVTITADTTNTIFGRAHKVTASGAVTGQLILNPYPESPVAFPPTAAIGLSVYVPDPTKITSISAGIGVEPIGYQWLRSVVQADLVTGWNHVRWAASAGMADLTEWLNLYRLRILVVTSEAAEVTIGHMWAECPEKAQVLVVSDSGYKTFLDTAWPDLQVRGIPVTWSLDPAILGANAGTKAERMSEADVAMVAATGDSIGLHGWDGAVNSTMTAAQIRADTTKALKWLQQRGYTGGVWRSAWVQNNAPEHAAAQPLVLAYATPSGAASVSVWPPTDRWNISRVSLHGSSDAALAGYFTTLQRARQLLVIYTHGIHTDGGGDSTPAQWANFLTHLDAGLAGGWLEGVTFEQLLARSGFNFRQGFDGVYQSDSVDASLDRVAKRLP